MINRRGLTLVWIVWVLAALAVYLTGPSAAGPVAILTTVWWNNWPLIVGVGVVLTLLVLATWLLPRRLR